MHVYHSFDIVYQLTTPFRVLVNYNDGSLLGEINLIFNLMMRLLRCCCFPAHCTRFAIGCDVLEYENHLLYVAMVLKSKAF